MLRAGSVKEVLWVAVYANTGESLGQGVRHELTLDDPEVVPAQQLREEVRFVLLPSHLLDVSRWETLFAKVNLMWQLWQINMKQQLVC